MRVHINNCVIFPTCFSQNNCCNQCAIPAKTKQIKIQRKERVPGVQMLSTCWPILFYVTVD